MIIRIINVGVDCILVCNISTFEGICVKFCLKCSVGGDEYLGGLDPNYYSTTGMEKCSWGEMVVHSPILKEFVSSNRGKSRATIKGAFVLDVKSGKDIM